MGGTFKRLVDQGHDVHVAYETSGNIAVGDEDMLRYFMMMDKIAPMFGFNVEQYEKLSTDVRDFVKSKTSAGDVDSKEIREIKTMIRQAEATIACNYIGVQPDHIHFLRLPFYETGTIKKGQLSERDVNIVKNLLQEVKPHQIFVAGDLADPHGTHRVCTDAVLAAIDEIKGQKWMKDCRIWMYRGAWAEWEIDHIEMAVPISPEELRFKRNSILKHQSQMENAPFLGVPSYVSYQNTRFIVFWSKNPRPLLDHLDYLKERNIGCYIQFTLNDYEAEGLEKGVPPIDQRIDTFKRLVYKLGIGRVVWRFDPMILTDAISIETLLEKVRNIGDQLNGYTEKLVFSYADIASYKKVKANLEKNNIPYHEWDEATMNEFAVRLYAMNKERGWNYTLATCGAASEPPV